MRSVIVYLRDVAEDEVALLLQRLYPFQFGPPWILGKAGDPVLYIDYYRDIDREMGVDAYVSLIASLGCDPTVSVVADVSGRHPGYTEAREFACALFSEYRGVAQDDYSDHYWTYEEIQANKIVDGHQFFVEAD
jgi:hypothetical protein